ncbi:MAG: winged helix-turn-helix transcriptional regulator [Oscillospiraceae bacterium]
MEHGRLNAHRVPCHDFCEAPPRVEYTLTELGESFLSVLDCMKAWCDENCLYKRDRPKQPSPARGGLRLIPGILPIMNH